jgi:hypothetical protein
MDTRVADTVNAAAHERLNDLSVGRHTFGDSHDT